MKKLFNRKQKAAAKPNQKASAAAERPKSGRKWSNPFTGLFNVLNGNILTREDALKHLPFLMFLAGLCLVYIANGYFAEGAIRSIDRTGNQLKELRSEYITTKSDLMFESKQSQVAKALADKQLGLKESVLPPEKIVVPAYELNPKSSEE